MAVAIFSTLMWCGATALLAGSLLYANGRIAELQRQGQPQGFFAGIVPYAYVIVLPMFWLSFPLAIYWLKRRPQLARQARITIVFLLCWSAAITLDVFVSWAKWAGQWFLYWLSA